MKIGTRWWFYTASSDVCKTAVSESHSRAFYIKEHHIRPTGHGPGTRSESSRNTPDVSSSWWMASSWDYTQVIYSRPSGVPSVGCVCLLLIHSSSQRTYASSLLHKHRSTACAHPPSCTCLWSELSVITLWSGRSSVRLVPWHHRTRSDLSTPESAPLTSAHAPASPHCLPVSEGSQAALLPIPLKKPPFLPPLSTPAPHLSRQALLTQFLRPEILRSLFVSDPTISPAVGPDTSSFTRPKSAPSLGPPHFPYLLWGCSRPRAGPHQWPANWPCDLHSCHPAPSGSGSQRQPKWPWKTQVWSIPHPNPTTPGRTAKALPKAALIGPEPPPHLPSSTWPHFHLWVFAPPAWRASPQMGWWLPRHCTGPGFLWHHLRDSPQTRKHPCDLLPCDPTLALLALSQDSLSLLDLGFCSYSFGQCQSTLCYRTLTPWGQKNICFLHCSIPSVRLITDMHWKVFGGWTTAWMNELP